MEPKHTPTPWAIQHGYLTNGKNIPIAFHEGAVSNHADVDPKVRAQVRADAAFIVRAVNCHEELLRLVKELSEIQLLCETPGVAKSVQCSEMDELICEAREAIAKAETK